MAAVYGAGAAMGFSPEQVGRMSMWQFFVAIEGFAKANSSGDSGKLSEEEADSLFAWIQSQNSAAKILTTQTYDWSGDYPIPAGVVRFDA